MGYTQLRESVLGHDARPKSSTSVVVTGVGSMLVTEPDPGVALTHLFADLWLGVVSPRDFYRARAIRDCVVKAFRGSR